MATWKRYLFAVAIFLAVCLLKIFAYPVFSAGTPTLILPLVVIICAWFFDLGPGILVAALCVCLHGYLLLEDRNSLWQVPIDVPLWMVYGVKMPIFAATIAGIIWMVIHIKKNTKPVSTLSFNSLENCLLISLDDNHRIVGWNSVAEQYFLYNKGESLGSPWYRLFSGDEIRAGLPDMILNTAKECGAWMGEAWHARKNGSQFRSSIMVVRNGNGYHCIGRDITEQKQVSDSLERWRHIFYHSAWAATVVDGRTDVFTHVNEAYAKMHGYEVEELVGKPLSVVFAPEFMGELPKHIQASNTTEKDYIYESLHMKKDGTRFPVRSHVSVFKDDMGRPLFRSAITEDITEQRKLQKVLYATTEELRSVVAMKDDFNAVLAHELRNPLQPIRMTLHFYQQTGRLDSSSVELLDRNVHQIQRLVDDLMDVTRISKNKITLHKSSLDLRDMVTLAIEQVHPTIKGKDQKLFRSLPTEPVRLDADPARIQQIFANLLNNAAKYTDEGGHIWITEELQSDKVVVKIRDNGMGISPDMLPKVFDLYSQADPALHRAQGGLGLGLTLVKRLVELHGGSVHAQSEGQGKGSTFTVILPVQKYEDEVKITSSKIFGAGGVLNGKKILVVDDNVDAALSMEMMLALDGCEVMVGHDGEEALRLYEIFKPNIALLDIGLPKLDGYEVAKRIREREGGYETTLIAVTGYGQPTDILRSKDAGFDNHVVKPVEPNCFKQLVQATFEARQKAGRDNDAGLLQ